MVHRAMKAIQWQLDNMRKLNDDLAPEHVSLLFCTSRQAEPAPRPGQRGAPPRRAKKGADRRRPRAAGGTDRGKQTAQVFPRNNKDPSSGAIAS